MLGTCIRELRYVKLIRKCTCTDLHNIYPIRRSAACGERDVPHSVALLAKPRDGAEGTCCLSVGNAPVYLANSSSIPVRNERCGINLGACLEQR